LGFQTSFGLDRFSIFLTFSKGSFHMVDTFDSHATSITAPPSHAEPTVIYKALSGTKVLRVVRVMASGTTAADIIAEW